MNLRLRAKLLLAFFLLIVIPASVLGILSYKQAASSLQDTIEAQLQEIVNSTAKIVALTITSAQKIVDVASNDDEFLAALSGNTAAAEAAKELQQKNSDIMEDVFIADRNGQVVAASSKGTSSNSSVISVKDRDYFQKAITGQGAVSNVLLSRSTNKPVVIIAYPIKRGNETVGVLGATMDFNSLAKQVSEIKVGQTGYGYMIDNTGLMVYHPDKDKVLKENMLNVDNEQVRAVAQKMVAGKAGKDMYSLAGGKRIVAYAPAGQFIVAMTAPEAEYMAPAQSILHNTIIIVSIAVVIALSIAYYVARSIANPIAQLRDLMALAGAGDLSVSSTIKTKDEIGDLSNSFNVMINSQRQIVQEVLTASDQLASASEEMAASCEEVSRGSQEISKSIQVVATESGKGNSSMLEASQALVHLSDLIQVAKNKASSASDNSHVTFKSAEEGRARVTETVTKMQNIKQQTEMTSDIIKELDGYSQQIGRIIDTITAIAAQTNLLALNAAIEAARAGEHGRGFAVVAEEVRKLAEQSNNGAQEITGLIRLVTEHTASAVAAMNKNVYEVEQGVAIVTEAGDALDHILEAVRKTVDEIKAINDITTEEVASSDQLVKLIESIANVIQSVAAHSEEVAATSEQQSATMETIAASAEETSASANALRQLVGRFKV